MKIDPRGNPWQYAYDDLGRLILAEDPVSGQKSLERTNTENGFEVTYRTPLGMTTRYRIEKVKEEDGEFERRRIILPDGSETRVEE